MKHIIRFLLVVSLFTSAQAEQLVFVSLNRDQKLAVYELDGDKGSLALKNTLELDSGPGSMCLNPGGTRLYVAKANGSIEAFRIAKDATLEPLGESDVVARASYLSFHPSGKFLFSAYYTAGQVAVHRVGDDGKLSAKPIQIVKTAETAHCIVCHPEGKVVFVPHTKPNQIYHLVFDAETGTLTASDFPALNCKPGTGPRHLWYHPTNGLAYGSNEQGSSATVYRFIESFPALAKIQTITTLPEEGYEGKKSTSDIEVHPSGKYVYVANRGYNTIASFTIDEKDFGKMTPLEHTPTEPVTRSFNIAPDGKHLIAAGQHSGKLAVFRIGDDGKLTRTSTIAAGETPWWVQVVER